MAASAFSVSVSGRTKSCTGCRCSSEAVGSAWRSIFPLIYLDDQLPNLGPITGRESAQDIQLALLDIDLQQVDPVDAFLGHDAGEGSQLGGYRSGTQAVIDQIADFRRQPLVVR